MPVRPGIADIAAGDHAGPVRLPDGDRAAAVLPQNVGFAIAVEIGARAARCVRQTAKVVGAQTAGARAGVWQLTRSRSRAVGNPQIDVAGCVLAGKQRGAAEDREIRSGDIGKQAIGVSAGDGQFAGARRGSVGHPKTVLATRIVAFEQRHMAEDRKIGRKAGREIVEIEQPAGIGAGHRQLACPGRGPVRRPKIGVSIGVFTREQNLVAEDGEIGRGDVVKQPVGKTSGHGQLAGPRTGRVGDPEADIAARVFAGKQRPAGENRQIGGADVKEEAIGIAACNGQLPGSCGGPVGHPKTVDTARIIPLEQRSTADRRETGGKAGRKETQTEQPAGIGAGDRELGGPSRAPVRHPKVRVAARVLAGEHHLVAEGREIGRGDVGEHSVGITSGDRQFTGAGAGSIGCPEADMTARVFADE